MEEESRSARIALDKEIKELAKIEKVLANLNSKYEIAMKEQRSLQEETDLLQRRLVAADKLIG